jgi:serine protease AprX
MQSRGSNFKGWWFTAVTLVVALVAPAPVVAALPAESVVVLGGSSAAAAAAVHDAGGTVTRELSVVSGVAARVSAPAAAALARRADVQVTPDIRMRVLSKEFAANSASDPSPQVAAMNPGRRWNPEAGDGVGVALIDTGVARVPGLADKVVRGANFSDEGDGTDRYGHGTFMAGLIAGDGIGVAPAATVVSVKVAGRDGSTSLGQVLAGIGWVIEHAEDHDIRVINLSLGVDMPMAWRADPLSAAVEAAWASGITVVTSSGNDGRGNVTAPGRDPWVLTVGASDTHGTASTADDTVASFSGSSARGWFVKPEVVAPGIDIVSLRAPGSTLDTTYPAARIGKDQFRGSGTSMSTALTAGAAAVVLWGHPEATPDDVKGALVSSAAGSINAVDVGAALDAEAQESWWQSLPVADGLDRPGFGPRDRMPWAGTRWSGTRWSGTRWSGTRWSGTRWSGTRWSGTRWSGTRWSGTRWSGTRWSGTRWSASEWG